MSQLEFTDEYSVEEQAVESGGVLLTTLLVGAGLFILVGIIFLLVAMGHRYGVGPFPLEASSGSVAQVSKNGSFVTFTGPIRERVSLGDVFFVYRGSDYVGRVELERHPDAAAGDAELQVLAEKTWMVTVNPNEYVGRVLTEYTVVDIMTGRPDIRAEDKLSSIRPSNLAAVAPNK